MFDTGEHEGGEIMVTMIVKRDLVTITFPNETTIACKMVALMRLIDAARIERDAQGRLLIEVLKA